MNNITGVGKLFVLYAKLMLCTVIVNSEFRDITIVKE